MQNKIIYILLFFFLTIFIYKGQANAKKNGDIDNLSIIKNSKFISLDTSLKFDDTFKKDILEAIQNGIETTFIYKLEIKKKRILWWDKRLFKKTIRKTAKYDSLKKEYRCIERDDLSLNNKEKLEIYADIQLLTKCISTLSKIKIDTGGKFYDPKGTYYIRVKAEMEPIKFWFPFNYVLFFVSVSDFHTSWRNVNLTP